MFFKSLDKNSIIISIIVILFICLILLYSDFFKNSIENVLLLIFILIAGYIIISDIPSNASGGFNNMLSDASGGLNNMFSNVSDEFNNMFSDDSDEFNMSGGSSMIDKSGKHSQNLDNNVDCTHPFSNKPHDFIGGSKQDLMKEALLDPAHNLKEVAEQLILLEDHLAHPRRRCHDCITKHYLTIEAFLREAITLDKKHEYFDEIQDLLNCIKPVMIQLLQKIKNGKPSNKEYLDTCQILRDNRKKIMIKYALSN